ncbi:hypothetical protein [Mesorhizobium muleiense]|uniref:EF-hand domain-containing protein n=1 Tax=Mesorhizobium muleiense TaxID=1004279 RepID=A0A1G8V582_9HYPH|nr:hypothetical protein [Mesorhizobium muleiense]MCF6102460.1 hypothetical protein [Mesorhizobium muleiense]SDJ61149.1 hypothetical protein SAMN05428953_107208 [Mesorhizobium muleiense]
MQRIFLASGCLVFNVGLAIAAAEGEFNDLDLNGDRHINAGTEARLVAGHLDLTPYQKSLIGSVDEFTENGIPIELLVSESFEKAVKARCAPDEQRFFLTDKMVDTSVLNPEIGAPANGGAAISIQGDPESDSVSWQLSGAATYAVRHRCPEEPPGWRPGQLYLSGWAASPFVEFDGAGDSDGPGVSLLRFGIDTEFQLFSGIFNVQQIDILPYFQTDFAFEGEIYGVSAAWTPVLWDVHLNIYRSDPAQRFYWWWTLKMVTDVMSVVDPGRTGLEEGSYAWLGGSVGLHARVVPVEGWNAIGLDAEYNNFYDAVSGQNVGQFTSGVALFLTENENAALSFRYERGTSHETLEDKEEYLVSLTLKL